MKRIAHVIPSLNALVEEVTGRMLAPFEQEVTSHYARIRVTHFRPDESNGDQFEEKLILDAVELLTHMGPDAVVWNGSSGALLGLQSDLTLCESVQERFGIPFTTTMLATRDALEAFGAKKFTMVTPYIEEIADVYSRSLEGAGLHCVSSGFMKIADPRDMVTIDLEHLVQKAHEVVTPEAEALLIVCTNFPGAYVADRLERELGIPVIDSTVASVWKGLRLGGVDASPKGWGRLLELA